MTTKTTLGLLLALGVVACTGPATTPDWTKTNDESQFTAAEDTVEPVHTLDQVRFVGVADYAHVPVHTDSLPVNDPLFAARRRAQLDQITQRQPSAQPLPSAPPSVKSSAVSGAADGALYGFPGIAAIDTDTATHSQGITPPDQALCAGNGYVVEAVNSALAVYDILGQPVSAPVDIAAFFQFPAAAGGVSSFPSDPKCYFDQATGRFFATILRLPSDASGNLLGSELDIAVSTSDDPRGKWNVFEVELTDDGTHGSPNHPHCPCLGDQPLIGADTNGFYVTTNEFGLSTTSPGFNGAQVYALSKKALVGGHLPAVVHLANLVLANGIGFSIQPAASPGGTGPGDAGGTEYFLSSLDFNGSLDNRIAVWGLSNTSSLDAATPAVKLEHVVLQSEAYGFPPPAAQKSGPQPLAACLATGTCPGTTAKSSVANPLEQVDTNDDRMNQAVLAGGSLWAGLNTVVTVGGQTHGGIAWFQAEPRRLSSGKLGAKMAGQGYVAVANNDLLFPSIARTDDGRGAMTFAISGADYYPSAAYARMSGSKGPGDVRIAGAGAGPLDDWDGYDPFAAPGPVRFGDYSAALIDGETLWMATEFVPVSCDALPCGGRGTYTNWGTFVSRIDLSDTLDQ
ncbi:MAG TPA: hypothetical protein VIF15_07860 [Polyangiaceae bacterium]|jgi:hypothetical protein